MHFSVVVVIYDYFSEQHSLFVSLFIDCEHLNIPGRYNVRI